MRGDLDLADLDRMQDLLMVHQGLVQVELSFGRLGRNWAVKGVIEAELALECQVCMEALKWPVRCDVSLGLVRSIEEADRLAEDLEPMLVKVDEEIALADLVQDELILAIPTFPRHPDCLRRETQATESSETARVHPFADLAQLVKKSP
jgi:uncharacterized protein